MSWTTTLQGALADLTPDDEGRLIWLLGDPQLASFVGRAYAKLTTSQQEALTSNARTAVGLLSPRLQHAFAGFAEKIGTP
jgi:hypothetical protein